jgi:hypothetical protein
VHKTLRREQCYFVVQGKSSAKEWLKIYLKKYLYSKIAITNFKYKPLISKRTGAY